MNDLVVSQYYSDNKRVDSKDLSSFSKREISELHQEIVEKKVPHIRSVMESNADQISDWKREETRAYSIR